MNPQDPPRRAAAPSSAPEETGTSFNSDVPLETTSDRDRVSDIPSELEDFGFLSPPRGKGELGWLAHYRVVKLLGKGGMGMVFLAEDSKLKRPVALKVIRPDRSNDVMRKRFLREARACAAVQATDHIVTVYDVGEERGVSYLAMQYLRGTTLKALSDKPDHRISLAQVLRIGTEIAKGLAAAHANGLIHRDIKPANLWLEAPTGRIKILDFGLARPAEDADSDDITQLGNIIGTPGYMSPEQANGDNVDARTDLFSLGCVIYEMATGQPPFRGKGAIALLKALATQTPIPPDRIDPSLPDSLCRLIERLLATVPDQRPQKANQVVTALEEIEQSLIALPASSPMPTSESAPTQDAALFGDLDDETEKEVDLVRPHRTKTETGGKIWLFVVAGVCVAATTGLIAWQMFKGKSTQSSSGEIVDDKLKNTGPPKKKEIDRSLEERDRERMARLNIEEQQALIRADLERSNAGFRLARKHSIHVDAFGGNAIKSIELVGDSFDNLTALRALPQLAQISIQANKKPVDLKTLAGLPLTFLECKYTEIDVADLGEMKSLRHLDLTGSTVKSIEKVAVMYLDSLILNDMNVPHLDWLTSQPTIKKLEMKNLPVASLLPLAGLKKLEYLDFTGCPKVMNVEALSALPLREVSCTYLPTFSKVFKEHPTLKMINGKPRDEFLKD